MKKGEQRLSVGAKYRFLGGDNFTGEGRYSKTGQADQFLKFFLAPLLSKHHCVSSPRKKRYSKKKKKMQKKKRKDVRVTPFSAYCLCYK